MMQNASSGQLPLTTVVIMIGLPGMIYERPSSSVNPDEVTEGRSPQEHLRPDTFFGILQMNSTSSPVTGN